MLLSCLLFYDFSKSSNSNEMTVPVVSPLKSFSIKGKFGLSYLWAELDSFELYDGLFFLLPVMLYIDNGILFFVCLEGTQAENFFAARTALEYSLLYICTMNGLLLARSVLLASLAPA